MTASHANTRRWQRHAVELPVRILPCSRLPVTAVAGRGTGLSQGGMALYAGVDMQPDDLIEVEFPIPYPVRVMAAVRNRSGHRFGLEFLALPRQHGRLPKHRTAALPEPLARFVGNGDVAAPSSLKKVLVVLDRKLLEIARVQREIDALHIAVPLLAE
jgi:PilZ domain